MTQNPFPKGITPGREVQMLPWLDYASLAMPESHELILWWAQYLWLTDGNYRSAMQRVAQHFLTTVEFPDLESNEENEYKDFFQDHLNYRRELKSVADDFLCYGNFFATVYLPFKRTLQCRQCIFEQPIDMLRGKYDCEMNARGVVWKRLAPCPMCGNGGPYRCIDRTSGDMSKVRIVKYSPFEIQIAQNPFSQKKDIYWKIPNEIRRDIQSKAPIFIEETPMEYLEAIACGGDVRFADEAIIHLDETCVSGMKVRGWGIPRSISNFRTAWLQQTTNRADQAIAMDYTLGIRSISPAPVAGGDDPMQTESGDEFASFVNGMVESHRRNPASYSVSPFPLNYQFMGGEGENLLPADKLKFRQQEYLNQLGVPLEYHNGTLSAQAAPMVLQLFENTWSDIPQIFNTVLTWLVKVTARNFHLEETKVVMQKTTISYDEARKQIMLQLMAANQVSPQTALGPFGIDAEKEIEKIFKHQDRTAEVQREHAEKAQTDQEMAAVGQLAGAPTPSSMAAQQQQQGAGGAGGAAGGQAPTGGGGMAPQGDQTLQGMSDQAQQIASQLVSMPEYDRKQQLKALRDSNKDLHALVMSAMTKIRSQAASQGGQQLLAPPPGGAAPPPQ